MLLPVSSRLLLVVALAAAAAGTSRAEGWPWAVSPGSRPLAETVEVPAGFARVEAPAGSFGAWLRRLPLKPGRPPVRLFDGRDKANQAAHHAVVDVDVGQRDLQQCADAVMRLRAEWLFATGRAEEAAFHFTSGDLSRWSDHRRGVRPVVGRSVRFQILAPPGSGHEAFRSWLDLVFTYAGSASLVRDTVPAGGDVEVGDVFLHGGHPGHAALVVDVARNAAGRLVFLLLQSYMPAQEMHVLRNGADGALSPWYDAAFGDRLLTPEWEFAASERRRFPELSRSRPTPGP